MGQEMTDQPTVSTSLGTLRGCVEEELSVFRGVPMTAWAIRFTLDGPWRKRINSPARFSGSGPELIGWRTTWIGHAASIPCTTSMV